MITVTQYKDEKNLAEIFQALDMKFAFLDKDYKQVHQECKCRDFLGDCIWSRKEKEKVSIYGFHYSFEESPYDVDILRLSLLFPDGKSKKYFLSSIDNIQNLENEYKLTPTKVIKTTNPLMLVVEADKEWQDANWKLSLYTFLIKCASYENNSSLESPENEYIYYLDTGKLMRLMDNIRKESYVQSDSLSDSHNNSGWVSIIKNKMSLAKKINNKIFGEELGK